MPCKLCSEYGWENPGPVIYKDENGLEFCVFHVPIGHKDMEVDDFNEYVFSRIDRAKRDQSSCNLKGVIFPGNISFARFSEIPELPQIDLHQAKFYGNADFSRCKFCGSANFSEVEFERDVDFTSALFEKRLTICNVSVSGKVKFFHSIFNDSVDISGIDAKNTVEFNFSRFESSFVAKFMSVMGDFVFFKAMFMGDVTISGVHVTGSLNCRSVKCYKTVCFKKAYVDGWYLYFRSKRKNIHEDVVIKGDANFADGEFYSHVDFSSVTISGKCEFNMAKFISDVSFTSVKFNSDVNFSNVVIGNKLCFFSDRRLKLTSAGIVSFKNISVENEVRVVNVCLDNFSFIDYDLTKFKFENCEWKKDKEGKVYIFDILNNKFDELEKFEIVYRILRK